MKIIKKKHSKVQHSNQLHKIEKKTRVTEKITENVFFFTQQFFSGEERGNKRNWYREVQSIEGRGKRRNVIWHRTRRVIRYLSWRSYLVLGSAIAASAAGALRLRLVATQSVIFLGEYSVGLERVLDGPARGRPPFRQGDIWRAHGGSAHGVVWYTWKFLFSFS